MNEWISVKEKMPEQEEYGCSEEVLMVIAKESYGNELETIIMTGWYDFCYERWFYFNPSSYDGIAVNEFDAVTHWMYMPKIPSEISEDDCVELSEWGKKGMKEADNPGVFLERPEKVKLGNAIQGIPTSKIIKELPPDVGKSFGEAMNMLLTQPDRIKRCEEYGKALDGFNEEFLNIPGELSPLFRRDDWRSGKYNYVFLKGYSKQTISELIDIGVQWERENGDCGSSRIFLGDCHISLDNGEWVDALDVSDFIVLENDGKIYLKDWDDLQMEADNG